MSVFEGENLEAGRENRPDIAAAIPHTLEDVMGSIQRHPTLRERKRREILSALRVTARRIGRTPAEIAVVPTSAFRKQLEDVRYMQAGITAKRWVNIRSLTVRALTLAGVTTMASRHNQTEHSAEWAALRRKFPSVGYSVGLSRFIYFCTDHGIGPQQVNEAHFEEFRQSLETASLVRKPTQTYRTTCRLWDKAGDQVPGWPSFRTGIKAIDQTYSLDWSEFPVSFKQDVETFLSAGGNKDIFAEDYVPSVRPATVLGRRKSIRQMATALARSGVPLDQITSLAALVNPDHAKAILRFFLDRAGGTPKDSIYGLACLLRAIARYWMRNHDDLPKLDLLCRALAHQGTKKRGMKERNRRRLRQFDDEANLIRLLHFPIKLFQLGRKGVGGKFAKTYAMYGVATEILLRSAIRIKNVVNLKIGTNLILPTDRKKGRITLWLGADEVKNGVEIEMRLPVSTSTMILSYLEEFRPDISAVTSDWLFPNESGECRNVISFSNQISVLIDRHADLEMHAHLFRHFALKLLEEDDPNSAESGRRLLVHKNIQTTLRSYSEGKTKAAHQQFEEIIESRRAGTGKSKRSIAQPV